MTRLIRLRLLEENSQQGFPVILEIIEEGSSNREYDTIGFLPSLPPQLELSFRNWRSTYCELTDVRSCISPEPGIRHKSTLRISPKSGVTNCSYSDRSDELERCLNEWLNSVDSRWQPIRDSLIANKSVNPAEEIRAIVETDDIRLRRLPWQEWDLFTEYYPQAEVALSAAVKAASINPPPSSSNVRILLAVGRSDGINTEVDLQVIQKLKEKGAEVISLIQPKAENLYNALREEPGYHIFIFTGHSGSREDGQIGWIEVNETDSLRIKDFKDALKRAIKNGLQLAIFNSCDGLGLARQLAEFNLPQSIVMREPVPDAVAQDFLKQFFTEFTKDKSLFASVREARERLEHWNLSYPGAKWLPTICIGSSVKPLNWQGLSGDRFIKLPSVPDRPSLSPPKPKQNILKLALGASLLSVVFLFLMGILKFSNSSAQRESPNLPTLMSVKEKTPDAIPQATLRYGGSTTWAPIRGLIDAKIVKVFPEFNLVYTQSSNQTPGSGSGIKMLLDAQLSFAQSSRPVKDSEYEIASRRGWRLKQVPVAFDGIAIVVHPNLNIKGLTLEQLKNIYTGKIVNWNQIGGPNLKIVPYSRPGESGTTEFFKENVLNDANLAENVVLISTTTEAIRKVGKPENEGGIYFASAPEAIGQCIVKPLPISRHVGSELVTPYKGAIVPPEKCPQERNKLNFTAFQNGEYPLTRRLFVLIKQDSQIDEKAGEAYAQLLLTDEGQKLIEEAGFIPIRSK